jgi:hypothetical protein
MHNPAMRYRSTLPPLVPNSSYPINTFNGDHIKIKNHDTISSLCDILTAANVFLWARVPSVWRSLISMSSWITREMWL